MGQSFVDLSSENMWEYFLIFKKTMWSPKYGSVIFSFIPWNELTTTFWYLVAVVFYKDLLYSILYVLVETESLISVMISDDNWGNSSESDKTFSSNVFLLQKHDNKICAFLQYVDVVVPDHNDNNNNNLPSFDPMKQFGLCI